MEQHLHEVLLRRVQQDALRTESHVDDEQLLDDIQPGAEVGRGTDCHRHKRRLEHVIHEPDAIPEHAMVVPCQALVPGALLGLQLLLHHRLRLVLGVDLRNWVCLDAAGDRGDEPVEQQHDLIVLLLQLLERTLHGVRPHLVLVIRELRQRVDVPVDKHHLDLLDFVDEAVHLHQRLHKQGLREEAGPAEPLPAAAVHLVAGVGAPLIDDLLVDVVLEEDHGG
mmetsp:Transcript_66951/g.173576  ORF Transcript_66951/g.173576 Transcript_66951/m.173576 type:complete len:223 (+) Transcript_66951:11170-11838(+)